MTGILAVGTFRVGTAAADADGWIIYNSTTGTLLYDVNSNVMVGGVQIALLTPGLALTNADFVVI